MTVTLPITPRSWPTFRILVSPTWTTTYADWIELREVQANRPGFELVDIAPMCLPDEGQATFRFHYGRHNGGQYWYPPSIDATTGAVTWTDPATVTGESVRGEVWNPDTGTVDLPDMRGWYCIIEHVTVDDTAADGYAYQIVFWGKISHQVDKGLPGAYVPQGVLTYVVKDGLWETRDWILDRHWMTPDDGTTKIPLNAATTGLEGNPGYNARGSGRMLGNRTGVAHTGLGYDGHKHPGAGTLWNNQQVLEHALASASKPDGVPAFTVSGQTTLLSSVYAVWEVSRNMSVRELLARVCDRRRALGTVHARLVLTSGTLSPQIYIAPQLLDDVEYTPHGAASAVTLPGADTAGTTYSMDVIGDHRLGPDAAQVFQVGEVDYYGALETYGERLTVMIPWTLNDNAFAELWTESEETEASGLSMAELDADPAQFGHVWRLIGIPRGWEYQVGAGYTDDDGGDDYRGRCDYRIADDGSITVPLISEDPDTSPLVVELADELPIYYGYDYTGSKSGGDFPRWDAGSPEGDEAAIPIMAWRRVHDADLGSGEDLDDERWIDALEEDELRIQTAGAMGQALDVRDAEDGSRYLAGDTAAAINFTVALRSPYRLRYYDTADYVEDGEEPDRIKRIHVPGMELHLAHPYAIWGLDTDEASDGGYQARRGAGGGNTGTPGELRDDREALSRIHALGKMWYLRKRHTLQVQWLDGCFGDDWPGLGDLVETVSYNGRTVAVETPVTAIMYDHTAGTTRIQTTWADREWK